MILLAGIFIAGCSNDDTSNEASTDDDQVTEDNQSEDENTYNDDGEEKKDVYQIGETATITSRQYKFDYEVTVNDFELTTDDVGGKSLEEDYGYTAEEDGRIAVANVTIKNISDETYIPNEKISAQLEIGGGHELSDDEIFTERDEELKPGAEITGDLVFTGRDFYDEELVYLAYEFGARNYETKFELPIPEK